MLSKQWKDTPAWARRADNEADEVYAEQTWLERRPRGVAGKRAWRAKTASATSIEEGILLRPSRSSQWGETSTVDRALPLAHSETLWYLPVYASNLGLARRALATLAVPPQRSDGRWEGTRPEERYLAVRYHLRAFRHRLASAPTGQAVNARGILMTPTSTVTLGLLSLTPLGRGPQISPIAPSRMKP